MDGRENQVRDEIESLWTEVFGEPPSIRCQASLLAEVLVRSLSAPPPYGDPAWRRDREPLAPHRAGDVTKHPDGPN